MALRALLCAAFVIVQIENLSCVLCAAAIENCQWLLFTRKSRISRAFGRYNWKLHATQWKSHGTEQRLIQCTSRQAVCYELYVRSTPINLRK